VDVKGLRRFVRISRADPFLLVCLLIAPASSVPPPAKLAAVSVQGLREKKAPLLARRAQRQQERDRKKVRNRLQERVFVRHVREVSLATMVQYVVAKAENKGDG